MNNYLVNLILTLIDNILTTYLSKLDINTRHFFFTKEVFFYTWDMQKNIRTTYILVLDIIHTCILLFTYFGGIYAFMSWNFLLQTIHFAHILTISMMILYFWRCLLTDYTNALVEKNNDSRKEFSDFTQYIFFQIFRIKLNSKFLKKFNMISVIVWIVLFLIAFWL